MGPRTGTSAECGESAFAAAARCGALRSGLSPPVQANMITSFFKPKGEAAASSAEPKRQKVVDELESSSATPSEPTIGGKGGCPRATIAYVASAGGGNDVVWQPNFDTVEQASPMEPPKKVAKVKKESTGKTARMLEEAGSPQVAFFGVNQLKKMYTPDTGSSAYTEDSPVNLHHPDYQEKTMVKQGLFLD